MKAYNIFQIFLVILLSSCGPAVVSVTPNATLPVDPFSLSDLVVSFINVAMVDMNGNCLSGYEVSTTITNQGTAPADNVTVVEMSTGYTITISRLEAGQNISLRFPATPSNGTYLVNVDPQNVVSESNEMNNNLSYLYPTPTPPASCSPQGDATPTPIP
jgi:subtilase family serine protease